MDIVCSNVIFVQQLCSIQLADPEIFKVSTTTHVYLICMHVGVWVGAHDVVVYGVSVWCVVCSAAVVTRDEIKALQMYIERELERYHLESGRLERVLNMDTHALTLTHKCSLMRTHSHTHYTHTTQTHTTHSTHATHTHKHIHTHLTHTHHTHKHIHTPHTHHTHKHIHTPHTHTHTHICCMCPTWWVAVQMFSVAHNWCSHPYQWQIKG